MSIHYGYGIPLCKWQYIPSVIVFILVFNMKNSVNNAGNIDSSSHLLFWYLSQIAKCILNKIS